MVAHALLETPDGRPRTVLVLADVLAREISASADKILQLLVRAVEEALAERDARPPRLALVVGGTDIGRLVLRSVLERVGYDVEAVRRVSDAVHRSRDAEVDLVLFDIDLQESAAEEGLRALQSAVPGVPRSSSPAAASMHWGDEARSRCCATWFAPACAGSSSSSPCETRKPKRRSPWSCFLPSSRATRAASACACPGSSAETWRRCSRPRPRWVMH